MSLISFSLVLLYFLLIEVSLGNFEKGYFSQNGSHWGHPQSPGLGWQLISRI